MMFPHKYKDDIYKLLSIVGRYTAEQSYLRQVWPRRFLQKAVWLKQNKTLHYSSTVFVNINNDQFCTY